MKKKDTSISSDKFLLSVEGISFNYPAQHSFNGIRNLSLNAKAGEFISILGKSGSGKTTLLKCVFGLEEITDGKIFFHNEEMKGPSFNLIPGHKGMSFVSQDFYVLENHTVAENITDKLSGYNDLYKQRRTKDLLNVLQLKPFENKKAKELSSGQKQRSQ
jgi:iron(III) transport system ATP-binding protein